MADRGVDLTVLLSMIAGVLVLGSMLGPGTVVPAACAVGADHVALEQISRRGERGRKMALTGLGIGYAVASWGLVVSVAHLPARFASV